MTRRAFTFADVDKRGSLAALALGLFSATGFQPLGLWPIALLAVGLFVQLIAAAAGWRRAAWLGWLFGLAHFTFGNSWIATAFTYQSNMPAILGWAAVPLLALYLAIYPGLAAGAAHAIAARGGRWALVLGFAGCWIVAEWLRSWVFTGYAWNPFGIALLGPFDRPGLAALSPFMGTYALSGLAIFLGAALVQLLRERAHLSAALVATLLTAGMYFPAPEAEEGQLAITIVQPDLRQERLSDPLYYEANFTRLAQLSRPANSGERRLVLWPESGMVDYLRAGYPQRYYDATTALSSPEYARSRLARVIGEGSMLLTGAVDLEIGSRDDGTIGAVGAYNAVTAVNEEGEIAGSYAKAHLVPYGEYLPMRRLLEPLGLSRLVPGSMDFLPGPGPRTLDLGEYGRAGIQICYEIVFSGQVAQGDARPDYIFNPSNDGWFGAFGPPQHLSQARLRAIEEGLPVLRATTTGISAVIDARGVVREYVSMQVMDRIDAKLPRARSPTLFAMTGNILALGWALGFLLAGYVVMRRRPR